LDEEIAAGVVVPRRQHPGEGHTRQRGEREEHARHCLGSGQTEPDRVGQHDDGDADAECEGGQGVPRADPDLAPPDEEDRHDADHRQEGAHDEHLRGDEELHDEEGRQAEAIAAG
jgi:hypothetical protein